MIVCAHVATGALAGAAAGSRGRALAAGAVSHALADAVPHEDFPSRAFETASGLVGVLLLAARLGPLHPATLGAVAAAAPDLEHVLPLPRPGGRKLYPSHRVRGWHRAGGFPARAQLAAAVAILALLTRG